jgi:methyl-accepting chemotaxis protein
MIMISKMTVGRRIVLGFAVVLLIAVALGAMGVSSMLSAKRNSEKLALEYVPEVDVATSLRGAANRVMYQMRGYGMSEEEQYYQNAQAELEAVNQELTEARDLAARAKNLKALKGHVQVAQDAVDEYQKLMEQTQATIADMNKERTQLDLNAAAYMQNCAEFLNGQNEAFRHDLDDRQKKVALVTDIVDVGTQARVANFKAQCANDMELMQQAIDLLDGLKTHTGELRSITEDQEDIKRIDGTEEAAKKYAANMKAYIETEDALAGSGEKMNSNAATYMENCVAFLESQNQAMEKEFSKQGANLKERLQKITLVNDVIDVGNAVRVMNYKAQATQDPDLMQAAIAKAGDISKITAKLRKITRKEANLKQIETINKAGEKYAEAMKDYLKNYKKLADHRHEMDVSAGQYVQLCAAFLTGQQEKLAHDMHERHQKITLVNDIIDLGNDSRVKAYKSQATRSPAVMEQAIANFPKLDNIYAELRKITHRKEDITRIEKTQNAGHNYAKALDRFLTQWNTLQDVGKQRELAGNEVIKACKETADAGMTNTDKIAKNAASSLARSSTIMVIGLLIGVVVGVGFSLVITRGITGPLQKVISGLQSGSEQVTAASTQVASASQEMAEGASEQASSLEEISSSLEEMTSMTRQNADNSRQANQFMNETADMVKTGRAATERMTHAIDEIKHSSDETAKIIKTIDEIAFQTNLLALNAAVEAARAGEAGKGFAVVAEEVRNLAQRSAEAAKNTAELIEGSQRNADNGVQVSQELAEALAKIVGSSEKVSNLIGEISAASSEQAQGIEQVSTAVAEMDKVVQGNAANAEESASASEELSAQALEVDSVVGTLSGMVHGTEQTQRRLPAQARRPSAPKKARPKPAYAAAASVTSQPAHPEEVIPLDDSDFKDF